MDYMTNKKSDKMKYEYELKCTLRGLA